MDFTRRALADVFKKKAKPTMFLSSMFQSPESNKKDTVEIVVDIKRNGERIAIDVVRGTGGRNNVNKRFTTKTYTPPTYNEAGNYNENERLQRALGKTEYDENTMADVIAAITDDQVDLQDTILRAIEKQAADAFFTGTVVLINSDTLDFKQKGTHKITPSPVWSDANGLPLDDLQGGGTLNRKDGQTTTKDFIMGENCWKLLKNNAQFQKFADFRRVDQINVRPPVMNSDGANFHGTLTIGEYVINLWTYPQFYFVPMGFGLANEGTLVPYIPTNKGWLGTIGARFDLYFAGIAKLVPADPRLVAFGIQQIPQTMKGDFHTYGYTDIPGKNVIYGVESAPLIVPTDLDTYCTFIVS